MGPEFSAGGVVIGRYVEALHAAALDVGVEPLVSEQLRRIKKSALRLPDHKKILKKFTMLKSFGTDYVKYLKNTLKLCDILGNFLDLLASNHRINCLIEICDAYEALLDKIADRKQILVTFARKIPQEEHAKLMGKLGEVFGENLECTVYIDPSIIDGFKIRYRSKILDYSIKSRIRRLHKTIRREDDEN
ncbi:MAG: ATP synthase F1 subunit delta [Holosporaceae bacterium]|jgi:F-type H+-transporting ATPase subunit delta|nr:ATP synthase F1 subunit delta [Holosporaceae bacterium]